MFITVTRTRNRKGNESFRALLNSRGFNLTWSHSVSELSREEHSRVGPTYSNAVRTGERDDDFGYAHLAQVRST